MHRKCSKDLTFHFFVEAYGPKHDKAVGKVVNDRDVLLTYYDFSAGNH